jgi:hypothetical protein
MPWSRRLWGDITSQSMLRQLEILRQGMYDGHYMLDTFRCRDHEGNDEVNDVRVAFFQPRQFSAAKRRLFSPVNKDDEGYLQNTMLNADSLRKLEKMLDGFETLMGDMKEFAVLLGSYPRICKQPYSTYLSSTGSCSADKWRRKPSSISCSNQTLPAMEVPPCFPLWAQRGLGRGHLWNMYALTKGCAPTSHFFLENRPRTPAFIESKTNQYIVWITHYSTSSAQ